MSSLKTNAETIERAVLNTTIKKGTLENFKAYCKAGSYPMNMILEAFMEQFVTGEFTLKIAKANKLTVDLEEDK